MKATEQQKLAMRQYWIANRDALRAKKHARYLNNREAIIAKSKQWNNSQTGISWRKAYYLKPETIEQRKAVNKARYWRHKQKRLALSKAYQLAHADEIKAKKAARFKMTYPFRKDILLAKNREDRRKHREKRRATQRRWQRENRHKMRRYEATYFSKNPWLRTAKTNRRRVRLLNAVHDGTAEQVISAIRSTEWIPCNYCGQMILGKTAHIDHVVPLSRGGSHTGNNLVPACEFCNCSKCDRLLGEWLPRKERGILSLPQV